jgi:hypothetical protein
MKPTPAETAFESVKGKVGRPAAQVWSYLQTEESRAIAGPNGAMLKQIDQIAHGTGLDRRTVQDSIIALAVNRLITKVTTDGRVAA